YEIPARLPGTGTSRHDPALAGAYLGYPQLHRGARMAADPAQRRFGSTAHRRLQGQAVRLPPGEHWKYDNSGYILLGAIIEKISGQSYPEFLRTHIFEPLGMQSSRYEDLAKITPGRVAGYMPDKSGWRNADYLSM